VGGDSTGVYVGTGVGEAGGLAVPGNGTGEATAGLPTPGLLLRPGLPVSMPVPIPPVPVPVPVPGSRPPREGEDPTPGLWKGSRLGDVYTGVGLEP
jgi:hypothetical protein